MKSAVLPVVSRKEGSKTANRAWRSKGFVPANIYGHGEANTYCAFDERDLKRAIGTTSAGNVILSLESEDKALTGKRVIVKAVEKDPQTWRPIHADFYEVTLEKPIAIQIPLEFVGAPKGVKLSGGIFQVVRRSLLVRGLVDDLPESISVDISEMDVNQNIHVSDLKLSEKLTVLDSSSYTICFVSEQAKEEAPSVAPGAEAAAGAAAPSPEAAGASEADKK
jgi:large subunit ribosomal protein L25